MMSVSSSSSRVCTARVALGRPARLPRTVSARRHVTRCAASYNITLLPGDGIGPEIISTAREVLEEVGRMEDIKFNFDTAHLGGAAIDAAGVPYPEETEAKCKARYAVVSLPAPPRPVLAPMAPPRLL